MVKRQKQKGVGLIETLVALLLLSMASVALFHEIQTLENTGMRSHIRIEDQTISENLTNMIKGNPSLLPNIDGVTLNKGASLPSGLSPLASWWSAAQTDDPFMQSISIETTPSACTINQSCLMTVWLSTKPPFASTMIKRKYQFQVLF